MSFNENTNKYEGFLYIITNDINDKVYIGQTLLTTELRWIEHKHAAGRKKSKTALYLAMKKYNIEKFHIQELERVEAVTEEELRGILNTKEIAYIRQYQSLTHENGYNITPGGKNVSKQQKEITYCFDINTGELFKIFSSRVEAGNYFNARSSSISNAIKNKRVYKGYYFSDTNIFDYIAPEPSRVSSIPIKQYKNGVLVNTYESCESAANILHLSKSNIYGACTGLHQSTGGFVWRFIHDEYNKYPLPPIRTKVINKYSKDDVYLETYASVVEASIDVNTPASNISAVLAKRKNCKTAGGYKWYYADDPNQPDKTKIITNSQEKAS